ncbi:MAG TPA: hypothetical protein DCW29_09220 [Janthinobacterium sp.]|nr:hypothetical protein [Janthinobacterium sp.]
MNRFPSDFHQQTQPPLTGFGGDASKNQQEHRAALQRRPVILVHGNATNSADPQYGMLTIKSFLSKFGYHDCEIWAMDYLGENNTAPLMPNPHTDKIDVFRDFVDRVKDYLGVERLDFIAHSLGCGMVNAYLRGLQKNGEWNNGNQRFDAVATFVSLAGANHGLGKFAAGEFQSGAAFDVGSRRFKSVAEEDTPFGLNDTAKQIAPVDAWKVSSALDNNEVRYVAFTARGDFVDAQLADTGRRDGADLNQVFNLGSGQTGHEKIVKDATVFDALKPYLNQPPLTAPVTLTVDKDSGDYGALLKVVVGLAPADAVAHFRSKRLTRTVRGGFIVDTVLEDDSGIVTDGQPLSFAADGEWELLLSAAGAADLTRTYGVNVTLPEATILTDNSVPFQGALEVDASASRGTVFFSLDGQRWNAGAKVKLSETSKVYVIAIDTDGLASPIVSRSFEKKAVPQETATLTEHFIAHRISVQQYIEYGQQVGYTATITLYFINDHWVRDPDTQEIARQAPLLQLSAEAGVHEQPLALAITARHRSDAAPLIYYTLDGSVPNEHAPYFRSAGVLRLAAKGSTTVKCRARDASGNWSELVSKTYTMHLKEAPPVIACDKPSGEYAGAFEALVSATDDVDRQLTVYYTRDGSAPSDPHNPNRHSFVGSKTFTVQNTGNQAIFCYAKNSLGKESLESFAWQVYDPGQYPETSLSPSMGGSYAGAVNVALRASEPCEWTKYTRDGSEPSDTHGERYSASFAIEQSCLLKFRSKDKHGRLEPVKSATFSIRQRAEKEVFSNVAGKHGYVSADPDGRHAFVGSLATPTLGSGRDGRDNRAIFHFDTSALPDNVKVDKAYLEIAVHGRGGDAWADGRKVTLDVQQGYFGSSHAIQAEDWGSPPTAEAAATIEAFTGGTARSSDFSPAGKEAINRTGPTQVRLKMNRAHDKPSNCLFLKGGVSVKLIIAYSADDA